MEGNRESRLFQCVTALEMSCKRYLREAFEDHLRVALIQPGRSRYEQMKVADYSAKRVEPRILRPLQFYDCKGFFLLYFIS